MTLLSKGGTNNESDQPYTAQEQACQTGTMPYVAAGGTKFVDKANNIPTQQQIKTALIQHGPLAVCITATDALQGYAGGVFDEGSTATINHVVTLIGWNDDKQAWIIKNSWGPTWGEEAGGMQGQKGFAYISYTKGNNIGYAAAWIDAKQQNFAPNFLNNLRKMLPELTKPIAGTAMTLNPQAEVNLTLDANDTAARIALGSRFVVTLQEQPGTGYVYRVTQINTDMIKLVGTPILTSTPRPGGVQTKVFTFEAVKLGTSILEITNSGPGGEPGEPKWPQFRVAVHVERP
jgi:predicted secreted protein